MLDLLFVFVVVLLISVGDLFAVVVPVEPCSLPSSDPLIRCTSEGLVRGIRSDFSVNRSTSTGTALESLSVLTFFGIPYGESAEGERRFRKPVPKTRRARSSIYNATSLPNACYQLIVDFLNASGEKIWAPTSNMSEDCLSLNIWIPMRKREEEETEPLAVMVWIYGGGFTSGSVSEQTHTHTHTDGQRFISFVVTRAL